MNNLAWLQKKPQVTGVLKSRPEDFIVQEDLGFEPDGEGEHVLVYVRKVGCNTQFVAEALARFCGIAQRAVSYAGLKDRHAVTEQWFCLHLPGKETPDFSLLTLDGCCVLRVERHRRKLRIGTLKGNSFSLVLRQISDRSELETRLLLAVQHGVPNYFGVQRFGHDGNNLRQARLWARNEIRVRERNKRSFYLSASRSALFNHIVSQRLHAGLERSVLLGDALQLRGRGSWFVAQDDELIDLQSRVEHGDLLITGALPGDGELGTNAAALAFEQECVSEQDELLSLLRRERVEPARRALLVMPQNMHWEWQDEHTVTLCFWLPAGSFATSIVRELMLQDNEHVADITE